MFLHQADILTPTHLEPLDLLDPLHIHMVQKITFSYHLLSPWHLFFNFFFYSGDSLMDVTITSLFTIILIALFTS